MGTQPSFLRWLRQFLAWGSGKPFHRAVTRCLKCGAPLPAEGECQRCANPSLTPAPPASALDKDLNLGRSRVPSFTELSPAFQVPPVAPVARPGEKAAAAVGPVAPSIAAVAPAVAPTTSRVVQPASSVAPEAPAIAPVASPTPPLARSISPGAASNTAAVEPSPIAPTIAPLAPRNEAVRNQVATSPAPSFPSDVLPKPVAGVEVAANAAAAQPDVAPAAPEEALPAGTIAIHAVPAAFWRRAIAWTVDGAAVVGTFALYLWIAAAVAGIRLRPSPSGGLDGFVQTLHDLEPVMIPGLAVVLFFAVLYASLCGFIGGRTLGYLLVGVRVVDRRGQPPSPQRAVTRALLACISFALMFAGFWLALVDRRRQTLHDKLTRTFVVRLVKG